MNQKAFLGPWIRRFLLEYLVGERNLTYNTQRSYRDTACLLLPFVAKQMRKHIDQLLVVDITPDLVKLFLTELEEKRQCSAATRNQRLATIRSLAHYIGLHSPEHIEWCAQIRNIPFKKTAQPGISYLEKEEIEALLAAPNRSSALGRRDYALLLFLYNTGARADEVAHVRIADLNLTHQPKRNPSSVRIHGKGNKTRHCPLWLETVEQLTPLTQGRSTEERVFLNRCGQPLTRFGIHSLVQKYAQKAAQQVPSMATKRISPHTVRHTTATHLLRAGVDINTIRAWLGHVSLNTTNIYAEIDLEMKAKALANCEPTQTPDQKPWRENAQLMEFLRNL